jgi:hypothetical protein
MRILIELFALFFALSVIYRRLIAPFLQGMNRSKSPEQPAPKPQKKNIETVDPKKIQDAEFEEIK